MASAEHFLAIHNDAGLKFHGIWNEEAVDIENRRALPRATRELASRRLAGSARM